MPPLFGCDSPLNNQVATYSKSGNATTPFVDHQNTSVVDVSFSHDGNAKQTDFHFHFSATTCQCLFCLLVVYVLIHKKKKRKNWFAWLQKWLK